MQVLLAKQAGFCSGVRRAFKITEKAGREPGKWYTLGQLVHNDEVVRYFAERGIMPIDNIYEIDTGGLIIRTHGVAPAVRDKAAARGIIIEDATCPLVNHVHDVAKLLIREGYDIIIFGDNDHPEIKGILGCCDDRATVVANLEEARSYSGANKIGIISQTTKDEKDFYAVVNALLQKTKEVRVFNTLCAATRQRQVAARELSHEVDLILVIGDQHSSNTKTLTQECQKTGVRTLQIQSVADIKPEDLAGINKVGITAGACTPDRSIKDG